MLLITVAGGAGLILLSRRMRGTRRATQLSRGFAVLLLLIVLGFQLIWALPANFSVDQSIPLQLSDVLRYVSVWALWSRRRLPVALTYFWALTLNTQALLTPNLIVDIDPTLDFVAYWSMHILVMWAALWLTWGLGLAPNWRDYRRSVLATLGWAVVTVIFNLVAGTNYGYLNHKPVNPSMLDVMPRWPYYLIIELVLVAAVWALITWPWMIMRRRRRRTSPD